MVGLKSASRISLMVALTTVYIGYFAINYMFLENQRSQYNFSSGIPEVAPPARPIPTSLYTRKHKQFPVETFNPANPPATDGPDPNHLRDVYAKPPYSFIIGSGLVTALFIFTVVSILSVWFNMQFRNGLFRGIGKFVGDVCAACCGMKTIRNLSRKSPVGAAEGEEDAGGGDEENIGSSRQPCGLWQMRCIWVVMLGVFSLLVGAVVTTVIGTHFDAVCAYNNQDYAHVCDITAVFIDEFEKDFGQRAVGRDATTGKNVTSPLLWMINGMMIARGRNQSYSNFIIYNDHDADLCYDSKLVPLDDLRKFLRRFGHFYELFDGAPTPDNPTGKFRLFPRNLDTLRGHSGPLSVDVDPCPGDRPPQTVLMPACNGHMMPFRSDIYERLDSEFGKDKWKTPRDVNHYALCAIMPWF